MGYKDTYKPLKGPSRAINGLIRTVIRTGLIRTMDLQVELLVPCSLRFRASALGFSTQGTWLAIPLSIVLKGWAMAIYPIWGLVSQNYGFLFFFSFFFWGGGGPHACFGAYKGYSPLEP